eukprot:6160661-Amphidinium_carterae.1
MGNLKTKLPESVKDCPLPLVIFTHLFLAPDVSSSPRCAMPFTSSPTKQSRRLASLLHPCGSTAAVSCRQRSLHVLHPTTTAAAAD